MATAVETVRAAWEAYSAGDIDGVIAQMAPSVETDLTHFEGWPEDGVYHGHAGFRHFITDWLAGWERYQAGVHDLVEVGEGCVLIDSWQRAYGAGSQVPVEMELAQIATSRDGQIVRLELWSDRAAAREEALRR